MSGFFICMMENRHLVSVSSASGAYGETPGRLRIQTPWNIKDRGRSLVPLSLGHPLTRGPCLSLSSPATEHPSVLGVGALSGHRALDIVLGESNSVDHDLSGSTALEASPGKGPARSSHVNSVQMCPVWRGAKLWSQLRGCPAVLPLGRAAGWLSGGVTRGGTFPSWGVGWPLWAVMPQGARGARSLACRPHAAGLFPPPTPAKSQTEIELGVTHEVMSVSLFFTCGVFFIYSRNPPKITL